MATQSPERLLRMLAELGGRQPDPDEERPMMKLAVTYRTTNGAGTTGKTVTADQTASEAIHLSEALPRLAIVRVEDAAVVGASSSFPPLVSVLKAANTRQLHHLCIR